MTARKILFSTLGIAVVAAAVAFIEPVQAAPARQQESVAEAARQARAKEKGEEKPAKVYTNDNITEVKGVVSVVGPSPASPQEGQPAKGTATAKPDGKAAAATSGAAAKPAAKPPEKGESYWRQKFADARRTLADDGKELDILQREYNLKQQQYYSNPNVAMQQQYNRSDLNKSLQQINAKKQDVEKDKQAISNLQDELHKAGGDPGWAREQ
jgi:hypothetical protein